MATNIQVTLTRGNCKSEAGGALPVPQSVMLDCENISNPTTSTTTTMAADAAALSALGATNPIELMWRVFLKGDTTIGIKAGATPTASATTSPKFGATADGVAHYFGVTELNEKLAFINA